MDVWNPQTFDDALIEKLATHSELIAVFHQEAQDLMDRHLNSDPYESLQPNQYAAQYYDLRDNAFVNLMMERRIRVWHYTRLIDDEAESMKEKLEPSNLAGLSKRLDNLVQKHLLTKEEAGIIYQDSPFHAQEDSRSDRLYTVTVPIIPESSGVEPLLENWGGESSYFWLKDETLAAKLKTIGKPRIVEIETTLRDKFNAFYAAQTVLQSWARHLGISLSPSNTDLAIKECLSDADVLKIHTAGDGIFEAVATSYPDECFSLLLN